MIDPKELAAALIGLKLTCEVEDPANRERTITRIFSVHSVTPPPKKPHVRVQSAPMWNDVGAIRWFDGEPNEVRVTVTSPPDYWLRRETIDEIPQIPSVVEAKK